MRALPRRRPRRCSAGAAGDLELQARWRQRDREPVSPEYMDGFSAFIHFYP